MIGFIGLGVMGQPMALRLAAAGTELIVWNRSPHRIAAVHAAGASVAASPAEVVARSEVTILMLAGEEAIDDIFAQVDPRDRTIVHMGTTSPDYSSGLAGRVAAAGGHYCEAPVSGSRKPAEAGELVAMLAGDRDVVERVRPILAPMCRETFACGPVPGALNMKLAVNTFLISLMTGLAEAFHFAARQGLDPALLRDILDAGQLASPISRVKTAKLASGDFEIQAGIADVLKNNRLVLDAARRAGAASPLLDVCHDLYAEALAAGHGSSDAVAVIHAIEARATG
jgi:3-hydroxyisobutyrate dehydrogenase